MAATCPFDSDLHDLQKDGEPRVHVWQVSERIAAPQLSVLSALLTPSEHVRAQSFRFVPDQRRFVLARGFLRALLGQVLDLDPRSIQFGSNPQGKPTLPGAMSFSVSHSDGRVLIAVASGWEIGVDIEYVGNDLDWGSLAPLFCTSSEQAFSDDLSGREFFTLWTLKEAWAKAIGLGLSAPLADTPIASSPQDLEPGAMFDRHILQPVSFAVIDAGSRHAAAVATLGAAARVHCHSWPSPG